MRFCLTLLLLMSAMGTTQLLAQAPGDPANGRRVAQTWCVNCHSLSPGTSSDGTPSFRDIARNPAKTEDQLRAWLTRPHAPMPDYMLSRDDINDIIAFLRTMER